MRLTRRGRVVAGTVVLGFVWATIFGIQSMNAVILPGAIALLAGWVMIHRAEGATLRREQPSPGYPDDARQVRMHVDSPASLSATVIDELPVEVTRIGDHDEQPVSGGRASYEVAADGRGVAQLGPARIRLTDPFGLVAETIESRETVELLTYPSVEELTWTRSRTDRLPEGAPTRDRHEFDRLREYDRSDAPRDIHWKSSAKRACDPLIVKEFVSETAAGDVHIVAESEPDWTDEMATAAASIALHLLGSGVPVGLQTRDRAVPVAGGDPQRGAILTALARTHGGRVDPDVRADGSILVQATDRGDIRVRLGGGAIDFDSLRAEPADTRGPWERLAADGGWIV